jgi:GDP-L-fucose synthase
MLVIGKARRISPAPPTGAVAVQVASGTRTKSATSQSFREFKIRGSQLNTTNEWPSPTVIGSGGIAQRRKRENARSPTRHLMIDKSKKIFVAGQRGLVGSAMIRCLEREGFNNLPKRDRSELDLADEGAVRRFFAQEQPAVVILAAAKVGGIKANNDFPVEFLLDNLRIQNNVIHAAHEVGVRKLLFLGSSCIYPKFAPQPIPETALLSGPLEPTNEAYAIAKIAGIKLCQAFSREYGANFISALPTNLYGPNDNFDLETSHVLAALLRKAHEAKIRKERKLIVWGSGKPRREFLHVDDLASACLFLLEKYDSPEIINVGCGEDLSVRELAELICDVVGFDGELAWDTAKPDGTPRKLLDITKLRGLGWQPAIPLRDGIAQTYDWFLKNVAR